MHSTYEKAVVITDPEGNETEFISQSAAARACGLQQSKISEMCRGKSKEAKGFKARFKNPIFEGVKATAFEAATEQP